MGGADPTMPCSGASFLPGPENAEGPGMPGPSTLKLYAAQFSGQPWLLYASSVPASAIISSRSPLLSANVTCATT